jgi:hypothetical protein
MHPTIEKATDISPAIRRRAQRRKRANDDIRAVAAEMAALSDRLRELIDRHAEADMPPEVYVSDLLAPTWTLDTLVDILKGSTRRADLDWPDFVDRGRHACR